MACAEASEVKKTPIVTELKFSTRLDRGLVMKPLQTAFLTGDEEAHRFEVRCFRQNESVSLESATITGYFIRSDGVTLPIPGNVENNAAVVQLPAACYVRTGQFSLVVKAAIGGSISAILWAQGVISRSKTDDVRDPLEKVPSLDELLAQIDRLEQAINKAETVANLTAEATTLAAGSAATAEYKNGKLTLGIPKGADGQKGDPGYTPVKGKDYFDGKDGYTPVKGKDYFDGAKGDPGYTPVKGKDYFDGKDGYTPVKGKDYFDGAKGDPGYTPVKGKDYFDGAKGDPGYTPVKGADYYTEADQESIVQQVIAALGTPVYGRVDENKKIILSSTNLPDGGYTLAFDNADGSKTELCTLEISGGNAIPGEPSVPTYTNLVPTTKTHTDLSTVFNGTGYKNGSYASSSSPFYGSDDATVCVGCIPAEGGDVFYIKGITLDASANSHCRVGIAQTSTANNGINVSKVMPVNNMADYATLETLGTQYYKLTIKADYVAANLTRQPYIWFSGIGTGENLIVTANEPIV